MTFLEVEKAIVQESPGPRELDGRVDRCRAHPQHRHTAARRGTGSPPPRSRRHSVKARHAVYEALAVAAEFFALRQSIKDGFDYPDAGALYQAYEAELFRFDQLYRHFCVNADAAKSRAGTC